jgi:hypothetical protein
MLKLERNKVELNIYGVDYRMFVATVGEVQKMNKAFNEDRNKALDLFVKFFVALGLPEEVVLSLEQGHLVQIMEELGNVKK